MMLFNESYLIRWHMSNTHLGSTYRSVDGTSKKRAMKRDDDLRGFPKIGTTVLGTIGGGVPFLSGVSFLNNYK
jgi:hypothetical protein